jgi:homoserine O-succinyltransferase/O-acetyltransferase
MPLIIEGRIPSRWAERIGRSEPAIPSHMRRMDGTNVALINNMPDPALEDTELQFFELLDIASGDLPVYVKLYSLTGVPRTERGECHLSSFYFPFDDLWKNQFDGVIITGTEPHCADLRDEPYWGLLGQVFDWAARNTSSTVLSCLAAHASALYFDRIERHRLADKQFGIFESRKNCEHAITSKVPEQVRFPHSRWNEVRAEELTAAGYMVLTESPDAGVDVFVKKTRNSMFVHFQGHPEYGSRTLAKEYRRDIKRFLRGERETYPSMPVGYFNRIQVDLLNRFRDEALSNRAEKAIESFPESAVNGLQNTWQRSATCVYQNWLSYITSRKAEASTFATLARVGLTRPASINNEIA